MDGTTNADTIIPGYTVTVYGLSARQLDMLAAFILHEHLEDSARIHAERR
jgi:hypothetical protein